MFPRPCRRPRRIALFLALLAAPTLALQEAPPPAETADRVLQLALEDALRIALRNNFDLEIERLSSEVASYDAQASWGAFDPVLNLQGTASESESEQRNAFAGATVVEDSDLSLQSSLVVPFHTGGNLEFSFDHVNSETNNRFATFDVSTADVLTAALTQPLLQGGWKRYATIEQQASEIVLQRQLEIERQTRARVLLQVYDAYWDLVSAQEELSVREIAVELGEQQLAQDQRRLEVGAGTEVDVLQSETNVAQQEELRVEAEYTLRQRRDLLRRLLAPQPGEDYAEFLAAWDWPIETLTELPEQEPDLQLDWRDSLDLAIELRPELAQRRLDIDLAELDLERAQSLRLPRLDLQLATSSAGFDIDPNEAFNEASSWDFPSSSASVIFSYPLWNRAGRYGERAARAALRRTRLVHDRQELDLLTEVRLAVDEVDKQRESVAAAIKSRTLAQRQLEAEETRQEVGLSTTFQVLEFQEDLAQALSTEVSAKAAYAKAKARLEFVEGRIGAELVAATTPLALGEPDK